MTRRYWPPGARLRRSAASSLLLGACLLLRPLSTLADPPAPDTLPPGHVGKPTGTGSPADHAAQGGQGGQGGQGETNQAERLRTRLGRRQAEAVERHIQSLHRALHITAAQEALWKPLAEAMRQNVVELDGVYETREKQYEEMSAVDNLRSYGQVQETHARNVQALIGPFTALYESFSDPQKRIADETFRKLTDNAVRAAR